MDLLIDQLNAQIYPNEWNVTAYFLDDFSRIEIHDHNQSIIAKEGFQYSRNPSNLGRARSRNTLADWSSGTYLIFLDNDVSIPDDQFLTRYIEAIQQGHQVIVGGHVYPEERPEFDRLLRWKVGRKNEVFPLEYRKKRPFDNFMTSNFCLQKSLFSRVRFREFGTYGHEDTFFGLDLEQACVSIFHIHNPVVHLGIDTNEEFLAKTEHAIDNLIALSDVENDGQLIVDRLKLVRLNKHTYMRKIICIIADRYLEKTRRYLVERSPNVFLYQFYKLLYYNIGIRNRE